MRNAALAITASSGILIAGGGTEPEAAGAEADDEAVAPADSSRDTGNTSTRASADPMKAITACDPREDQMRCVLQVSESVFMLTL